MWIFIWCIGRKPMTQKVSESYKTIVWVVTGRVITCSWAYACPRGESNICGDLAGNGETASFRSVLYLSNLLIYRETLLHQQAKSRVLEFQTSASRHLRACSLTQRSFPPPTRYANINITVPIPSLNRVLKVELHPSLPCFELLEYCKSKNILLTAFCPLGRYV